MARLQNTFLLFVVILIEGYIVLSSELIAMRQTIAYVGSGTDTISIIIAAVLLPLAFGYQAGGHFKQGRNRFGRYVTIRRKLVTNMLIAGVFLLPGLSYVTIKAFFTLLPLIGIEHRTLQIIVYCLIFLVYPVYLLAQTIPLISNYFSLKKLSEVTGHMLCFSTLGSFLGAVFSTIVLMSTIGVNNTVSLNFVLLAILVILLSKKKISEPVVWGLVLAGFALFINSNAIMAEHHVVKANKYNDLIVIQPEGSSNRHLIMNGNDSSKYNDYGQKHDYIELAERITIDEINPKDPPKDILIVGAGAFTFGHEDTKNNYVYVDLDGDLKEVAEKYILKDKIKENKVFEVMDIRAYFRANPEKKFDIIYLDAYLGGLTIPENLVTVEFFQQVKDALKDGGLMVGNFIASPNFTSVFSRSLDNTLHQVFPHLSRQVINEDYNLWDPSVNNGANIAYIYRHEYDYGMGGIYTDNLNRVFIEKPKKLDPP